MKNRAISRSLLAIPLAAVAICALPAYALTPPAISLSDAAGNMITVDSTGTVVTSGSCNPSTCITIAGSNTGSTIANTTVVTWSGTLGNFMFSVTGTYQLDGIPAVVPYVDINISSLTSLGAGTLTAQFTSTGVGLAPTYSINAGTTAVGITSVAYSTYVDPSNVAFNTASPAVLVGSLGTSGGSEMDLTGPSSSAGSITDQVVLTVPGAGASFSSDFYTFASPYVASSCPVISGGVENTAITPATVTPSGGSGSYYFSASGLPAGLSISPDYPAGPAASAIISGTPTQYGVFPYSITVTDAVDGTVTTFNCSLTVAQVSTTSPPPGLKLTKTAAPANGENLAGCPKGEVCVAPFQLVTYTYTVTNTGGTTLTNIVVVDDNATPKDTSDDFTVGTIASLAPGTSATLTWTTYPTMQTVVLDQNDKTQAGGTLAIQNVHTGGCTPNVNCNLKFILDQDLGLTDNCYGAPAENGGTNAESPCGGWGNAPQMQNLAGNNSATFAFYDSQGGLDLEFAVDYISQGNSPGSQSQNSSWNSYPSGYGSLGWGGGDGSFIAGNNNYIVGTDTTLTDDLNQKGFSGNTWNSPSPGTSGWNFVCGYTATINPQCFGSKGFGHVSIPQVQNCPSKNNTNQICHTPTTSTATNTATATATGGLSATAKASVEIISTISPSSPGQPGQQGSWGSQPSGPQQFQLNCQGAQGKVGSPFSYTPNVVGGKGPYNYQITSGTLPKGLTLNHSTGAITGTPGQGTNGSFNCTITVTDNSDSKTASANCNIEIDEPSGW